MSEKAAIRFNITLFQRRRRGLPHLNWPSPRTLVRSRGLAGAHRGLPGTTGREAPEALSLSHWHQLNLSDARGTLTCRASSSLITRSPLSLVVGSPPCLMLDGRRAGPSPLAHWSNPRCGSTKKRLSGGSCRNRRGRGSSHPRPRRHRRRRPHPPPLGDGSGRRPSPSGPRPPG